MLDVSMDTIRRYDKQGLLHATRGNDNTRYFSLEELEQIKFAQPLSVSQAAEVLNISSSTLRRFEERGIIKPERNENGERIYKRKDMEKFLHSDYFLRQKEVEDKLLEPLTRDEKPSETPEPHKDGSEADSVENTKEKVQTKVLGTVVTEQGKHLSKLLQFRKMFYFAGLFLATVFVLLITVFTLLFLLKPESTARFFGYRNVPPSQLPGLVLGAQYPEDTTFVQGSVLGKTLKPFGEMSLGLVKQINPQIYDQVVPKKPIEDVNDIIKINESGAIEPYYDFALPDSSYLKIPDKGLITNLNADYVRGKVPGTSEGDLVVYGKGNTIPGLSINTSNIIGSIGGGA